MTQDDGAPSRTEGRPSRAYLIFSLGFVALVALLALLLIGCVVYAPQIVEKVSAGRIERQ